MSTAMSERFFALVKVTIAVCEPPIGTVAASVEDDQVMAGAPRAAVPPLTPEIQIAARLGRIRSRAAPRTAARMRRSSSRMGLPPNARIVVGRSHFRKLLAPVRDWVTKARILRPSDCDSGPVHAGGSAGACVFLVNLKAGARS